MNIKDEAVEAACKAYADSRYGGEVSWPLDFSMGEVGRGKIDMRAALTAALPHMGGVSATDDETKAVLLSVLHHFGPEGTKKVLDSLPEARSTLASHEPAPEPAKDGPEVVWQYRYFANQDPGKPTRWYVTTDPTHIGHDAEKYPLARQSALTACQQEVGRLRAELIKSRNYWSEQCSGLNRHNAELVKALEEIASDDERGDYEGVVQFARAALGGQSNE